MSITSEMLNNITPLSDRVLLKPVEEDTITASGIILPESANKERPSLYEVISVWEGKLDKNGNFIKIELTAWDRVITGQYSGDDVKIDNVTYKIVAYDYILAKIA